MPRPGKLKQSRKSQEINLQSNKYEKEKQKVTKGRQRTNQERASEI
jgi:hypothetical protein